MLPMLPPWENRDLDDIEQEIPFVTYAWAPPLCPWCGQWLRPVDMRLMGMPFKATTACPLYHGLYTFNQMRWADFRPPKTVRASDGAWWTTLDAKQLRTMATEL